MPEFTLPRTGDVPLAFTGERVARSTSQRYEGMGQNRYHELGLYVTGQGKKYVLGVGYRSQYRDEGPRDSAFVFSDAEAVRQFLAAYDPVPPGVGFPPGEAYAEKQTRMVENLKFRFGMAVSELFEGQPIVERVE